MKPGPYQFCNECETERAHGWISEFTFQCIACNKETTVKPRAPIPREAIFPGIGKITPMEQIPGKDHLQPEELEELNQKLASEPKAAQSEPKKAEKIDPAGSIALDTELPKQGHEIKHTPLEQVASYVGEELKKKYKNISKEELTDRINNALSGTEHNFPTVTTDKHGNTHFKSKNMDIWTGPRGTKQMEDAMKNAIPEPDQVGSMATDHSPLNTIVPKEEYEKFTGEWNTATDTTEEVPLKEIVTNTIKSKPIPSKGGWADGL